LLLGHHGQELLSGQQVVSMFQAICPRFFRSAAPAFILAAFILMSLGTSAGAVVIDPSTSVGSASSGRGDGLLGTYYKFTNSYVTSLAQGSTLAAAMSGPTATFKAVNSCFPTCGTNTDDSASLSAFLGNAATGLSTNVADISNSFYRLTGYISIAAAGTYTVSVFSDDGTSLSIGGTKVISADGQYAGTTTYGTATFSAAGLYPILVEHFEAYGASALSITSNGVTLAGLMSSSATPLNVPEPTTLMVIASGIVGLVAARRRRR
jgi:hypothetical protein